MKSLLIISALVPVFLSLFAGTTPTPGPGACMLAYQDSKQVDVIQVINIDTGAVVRTVAAGGLLSPSGSVSVALFDQGGKHRLKIAQVTGLGFMRLIDTVDGDVVRVAWSPDAQKLALVMKKDETQNLYVIKPNGADLVQITKGTDIVDYPSWSPDGEQLRYLLLSGDTATVYTAKSTPESKPEQAKAFSPFAAGPYALTADAGTVFYAGERDGKPSIFVQTGNRDPKVLISVEKAVTEISLEPGGMRLVFVSGGQLSVVNTDGTSLRVLNAEGTQLSWQCNAAVTGSDQPNPRKK